MKDGKPWSFSIRYCFIFPLLFFMLSGTAA